ncbi:hypothetical protein JTE90_011339 [Oedothorax gibbosus]|uniref:Transcription elongation regulator 1 n=1 Tax=Oedothorax gibbosus TaxID=931172 RepID=A0AAV6VLZ1_9ARAC|nr:hypothetical protein JTE90_011339 [Oedothorax gibbosus]
MYKNDFGAIRHRGAFQNEQSVGDRQPFHARSISKSQIQRPPFTNGFPQQVFKPRNRGANFRHLNMNCKNNQIPTKLGHSTTQPYSKSDFPPHVNENYPHVNENYPHVKENCPPLYFASNICGMTSNLENQRLNYFCNFNTLASKQQEEMWIEEKSENGASYYYTVDSRVATWDKPKNVKINSFVQSKALTSSQSKVDFQENAIQNRQNIWPRNVNCLEQVPSLNPNFTDVPTRIIIPFPPPLYQPPPPLPFINYSIPSTSVRMPQMISNSPATSLMIPPAAITDITITESLIQNSEKPVIFNEQNKLASSDPIYQANYFKKEKILSSGTDSEKSNTKAEINETFLLEKETEFPLSSAENVLKGCVSNQEEYALSPRMKNEVKNNILDTKKDSNKRASSNAQSDNKSKDVKNGDKSRPVSSTPIPGSTWCVVWTGDNRVFFYDSCRKVSVWNTPNELLNRIDVKKLVQTPPIISEKIQTDVSFDSEAKKIKVEITNVSSTSEKIKTNNEKLTLEETVLKATKEREHIPHLTRVQMFMDLLLEKKVSAFSTFEKELPKIVFDSRYLLLTPKERKRRFDLYVRTKMEDEKYRKRKESAKKRENFIQLLEESKVTHDTRFLDFSNKCCEDSRFQVIKGTKERERIFYRFISNLHRTDDSLNTSSPQTSEFLELLKEQDWLNVDSSWSECKKMIGCDDRYLNINSEECKQTIFKDFITNYFKRSSPKGKEDRILPGIETQQREVQKNISVCMKELEEERQLCKHESLSNSFMALLVDRVRNPNIQYRNAIRCLKSDHRWENVAELKLNERERLFHYHIRQLKSRQKDLFHKELDELLKDIDLTSTWRDVKKIIQNHKKCSRFISDEKKCEREFNDYMKKRLNTAKVEFRELLQETKLITYASKELIKNTNHLEIIQNFLSKDKRYLVLKGIERNRRNMLMAYIDKLYSQGPPRPPTAPEPFRC